MLSIYLFLFHLQELPDSLKEQTYLKEWHVYNTLIQTIPAYIALFKDLRVLELSKNQINHLPAEIGELVQDRYLYSYHLTLLQGNEYPWVFLLIY